MTKRDFPWRLLLCLASPCLVFYAVCMRYPQGPRSASSRRWLHRDWNSSDFGAMVVAAGEPSPGVRADACVVVETTAHDYEGGVQWLVSRRLVATGRDGATRVLWYGGMPTGPANPEVEERVEAQDSRRVEDCFNLQAVPAAYGPIDFHWDAAAWPASEPGFQDVSPARLNREAAGGLRLSRTVVLRR